jgi:hypothetical protein
MIKTLAAANLSERDKLKIPRSVQQTIPIKCIYPDGIWQVGRKHSRTWKLTDINYIAASPEAQESIFKAYCAALNTLPTDATAKITIVNHRLNPAGWVMTQCRLRKADLKLTPNNAGRHNRPGVFCKCWYSGFS